MCAVRISLITVSRNAKATIGRCMDSVIMQDYQHIQYIVVDGNSDDGTWELILENKADIHVLIREADEGMYDAINKGIRLASGDVVGILNADDYFVDEQVLSAIAAYFEAQDPDILYADLDYVDEGDKVVRSWRSEDYTAERFNFGWMPPHPTFYAKRKLFDAFGFYDTSYGSAADYELMLRFMFSNKASAGYLNKVIVHMREGGMSNKHFNNRIRAWRADFKAMKKHGIRFPLLGIVLKPLRKIPQFIFIWVFRVCGIR